MRRCSNKQVVNKRPIVTTTEKHLRNFVPFVPGRKSYARATEGSDVLIIGSSMIQRIRKREFSSCVENGNTRFRVFPGATMSRINYYLVPELRENNFKKVVIHCGTNDLYDRTAEEIIICMKEVNETCLEHGVETVIFSNIVVRKCRKDIQEKRLLVNSLLKEMCEMGSFINTHFVDNGNIFYNDLYTDGLHLLESGSTKLANNILKCINSTN